MPQARRGRRRAVRAGARTSWPASLGRRCRPAVLAVVFVDIGGIGWMLLMAILGVRLPERALPDARGLAAGAGRRLRGGGRHVRRGALRDAGRRRRRGARVAAAGVPRDPRPRAEQGGATPRSRRRCSASSGSVRVRARGAAAPAHRSRSARQGHPDRRDGRHVPRRHRRLPRRPHVRPPSAGAGDLAEEDDRGPRLRRARDDRRVVVAGLYQQPGCRTAPRCCSGSRSRCWRRSATCSSR